jgi:hypothetical protein
VITLSANPGWTRAHLEAALKDVLDTLEKVEGSDLNLDSGPSTSWKHLPALYRLWWDTQVKPPNQLLRVMWTSPSLLSVLTAVPHIGTGWRRFPRTTKIRARPTRLSGI